MCLKPGKNVLSAYLFMLMKQAADCEYLQITATQMTTKMQNKV